MILAAKGERDDRVFLSGTDRDQTDMTFFFFRVKIKHLCVSGWGEAIRGKTVAVVTG